MASRQRRQSFLASHNIQPFEILDHSNVDREIEKLPDGSFALTAGVDKVGLEKNAGDTSSMELMESESSCDEEAEQPQSVATNGATNIDPFSDLPENEREMWTLITKASCVDLRREMDERLGPVDERLRKSEADGIVRDKTQRDPSRPKRKRKKKSPFNNATTELLKGGEVDQKPLTAAQKDALINMYLDTKLKGTGNVPDADAVRRIGSVARILDQDDEVCDDSVDQKVTAKYVVGAQVGRMSLAMPMEQIESSAGSSEEDEEMPNALKEGGKAWRPDTQLVACQAENGQTLGMIVEKSKDEKVQVVNDIVLSPHLASGTSNVSPNSDGPPTPSAKKKNAKNTPINKLLAAIPTFKWVKKNSSSRVD